MKKQKEKPKRRKRRKKPKLRPIVRITSDHMSLLSVTLDAGILILLLVWFVMELPAILGG